MYITMYPQSYNLTPKFLSAAFDLDPQSITTTFCLVFCFDPSSMNCHLPECNRAILFLQWLDICFGIVHTKFHDPRWKIMAPKNLQSFLFLLKKTFFGTQLSSVAEATIFHLGSQNFVCTISILYIYLPTAKIFCSSTVREVAISIGSPVRFSAGHLKCNI